MLLQAVFLVLGFAGLIKGADIFVDASVNIAKRLKIPGVVIGLTIVAIGTSAPEAVISLVAAAKGADSLAISNVTGSNMFNLLLAVGICALIRPIAVKFKEIATDFYVAAGGAVLLLVITVVSGERIHRLFGLLLFAVFTVYMVLLIRKTLREKGAEAGTGPQENEPVKQPLWLSILLAAAGCALIIAGGQFTVNSSIEIAKWFGVTERVIGLTVVAVGTSLPELVVSLVACRKGKGDVALGNVVGSSIFNLFFVLGLAGSVSPLAISEGIVLDLIILSAGSALSMLFAYTGRRVTRTEGFFMVLIYLAYMGFVIVR